MIAIRGATTVENDSPQDIKESVKELLLKTVEANGLDESGVICIMFSSTSDIRSFFPAKAAREAGFFNCALYSSVEPDIEGSLKKCIRIMILAESAAAPRHVYLRGAAGLRKDLTKRLNIAVDGPAGSGKSTVSKILAKRFNILYLDTGAMYRAFALSCLKQGADVNDENAVENVLKRVKISVKYEKSAQKTLVDGVDVSAEIRTPEISMLASTVSAHGCVRRKMVELQREIAAENSCILDGRDIGSNVLPDAEFKFFLTASPEIRAERRAKENAAKGISQPFEEVLAEIVKRDGQDRTRLIAPLVKADDAVEVDTGDMTAEEVADYIATKIQEKV